MGIVNDPLDVDNIKFLFFDQYFSKKNGFGVWAELGA